MKNMQEAVSGFLLDAASNVPQPSGAVYTGEDGLAYCADCHSPVQCRIQIFGGEQIVPCICGCQRRLLDAEDKRKQQEEIERRRRECFEGSDMIGWTFAADDLKDSKASGAVKAYAEGFEGFRQEGRGLLLYGKNGTGKTFYAACIANALLDAGYSVLMTNFASLANQLSGLREGKQGFIDKLCGYSLLVLDDLGAERDSQYMQEIVFSVVDARYNSGKPFIVTTNLAVDEIMKPQDFGRARIYSRILGRCFPLEVNWTDRRKAGLRQSFPDMAKRLGLQ